MKEPYEKGLAHRLGPESYAGNGNIVGVALTRGTRRPAIELRNHHFRVPTLYLYGEGNICGRVTGERPHNAAESKNLSMCENFKRENREILLVSVEQRGLLAARRNGQKTSPTVMLI